MPLRPAAHLLAFLTALVLAACAGPHGEKPALDPAVERPGATPYGFSGGYIGATGGGFR